MAETSRQEIKKEAEEVTSAPASVLSTVPAFETFNPATDKWASYQQRLLCHFYAHGVPSDSGVNLRRKTLFLSWVGKETFDLITQSLFLTSNPLDTTVPFFHLLLALDRHYDSTKSVMTATFDFWNCRQKPGQSFAEWDTELRELARHCAFTSGKLKSNPLERAIRDMYMIGTANPKIRQRLLETEDPDLDTAKRAALNAEKKDLDLQHMSPNGQNQITAINKLTTNQNNRSPGGKRPPLHRFPPPKTSSQACASCGKSTHKRDDCWHRNDTCNLCHRTGHIAAACRSATKVEDKSMGQRSKQFRPKKLSAKLVIKSTSTDSRSPKTCSLTVNGQPIRFELDTGADVTIGIIDDWLTLGKPQLKPSQDQLSSYGGQAIHVRGVCTVNVNYNGKSHALPLFIVQETGSSLCGQNWIDSLQINLNDMYYGASTMVKVTPRQIQRVYCETKLSAVLDRHNAVFSPGLGCCTKAKARLHLQPDAIPRFYKPRPIPFARQQPTKEELQRNVDMGVLEKIDFNKRGYAAPIVVVAKPNGKVRICGDFKVTVNQQIHVDEHSLPTIEDLFAKMNGGEKFSNLDLADVYLQVELEEDCKDLLAINTPFGLYRYNRMPFGIASAPAIFQRLMDQLLGDIPYCSAYLDDILITGRTEAEHLATLDKVLSRLLDAGFKCNRPKCSFYKNEVKYLGHIISAAGKRPDPGKVAAILKMPAPTTAEEVSSFLGKINFYSRFLRDYTDLCAPLYELKQKGKKFVWSERCQTNFEKLKQRLTDAECLVHYDPGLPLLLATDASSYGIGAVLSHRYPDGSERPIAFASKTLDPAEKNYSQIEKEGLSIIFGLKKFEQFLIGRQFELITDHRLLIHIFDPAKGIPASSANRLQRWALRLMGFSYKIVYRSTAQHSNADALSRLPAGPDQSFHDEDSLHIFSVQRDILDNGPLRPADVALATKQCHTLRQVIQFMTSGWPPKLPESADTDLISLFRQHTDLSIHNGILLCNHQIVIPKSLRLRLLRLLHNSHLGTVKTKQYARAYVWWPQMDSDIDVMIKSCRSCALVAPRPPADFQPWPTPDGPWLRVHVDFAGPFWGEKWLLAIDAKTKFAFAEPMGSVTMAEKTIQVLERIFDLCGPCTTIVSDNGPPFNSREMTAFYEKYAINHLTSPAYHPQSNGLCERFVRSFKEDMLKLQHGGITSKMKALQMFLRSYRWTPHSTTGIAPAQMMFNRPIRTELAVLLQAMPKEQTTNLKKTVYHVGQTVWVNIAFPVNRANWQAGWIEKRIGNVLYLVHMTNGSRRKAHRNQLQLRIPGEKEFIEDDYTPPQFIPQIAEDAPEFNRAPLTPVSDVPVTDAAVDVLDDNEIQERSKSPGETNEAPPDTQDEARRYPLRDRRPPDRFIPSMAPSQKNQKNN